MPLGGTPKDEIVVVLSRRLFEYEDDDEDDSPGRDFLNKPPVLLDVPLLPFMHTQVEHFCELRPWSLLANADQEELRKIQGIYTYAHPIVDGALLDQLPSLKVISNFGVGVDHIDLKAAAARSVPVGNTPGAVDGATADLTMALLLAAARNVVVGDKYARGPQFTQYEPGYLLGLEVFGSTLGIVGMGRIGQQVAKRAKAFDMRVLYHNRQRNLEAEASLGAKYATLKALLAHSHFVTLNVPLTAETTHFIGEAQLRLMRRDAFLINVARGPVVDQQALFRALSEGWIAGAALDVTEPEPLPRDHPLLGLDNLVITPHLGSATVRTRQRMGEMAAANLAAGLKGEPLPNAVRSR
ncbi:MAG: D-glycerate dehydrogenase [Acidobacteria bacterium]|nr:D-glycerate dehydrogenase [Acidobacteriota bacterium]MCI0620456.1 D-glycerate dehydrogenase [Acidobacteriota bacterium]MCI0717885.1 D-glycerate dehydrogenase [Acidobacteriota bacterium]